MSDAPVVVVGAGLSGLRCAGLLAESGVEVVVFEASDGVGGRARTDTVDGFRLDRGFQGTTILTFGGGVNEIQRDLIAMFGLGMPRTPRM